MDLKLDQALNLAMKKIKEGSPQKPGIFIKVFLRSFQQTRWRRVG